MFNGPHIMNDALNEILSLNNDEVDAIKNALIGMVSERR